MAAPAHNIVRLVPHGFASSKLTYDASAIESILVWPEAKLAPAFWHLFLLKKYSY